MRRFMDAADVAGAVVYMARQQMDTSRDKSYRLMELRSSKFLSNQVSLRHTVGAVNTRSDQSERQRSHPAEHDQIISA